MRCHPDRRFSLCCSTTSENASAPDVRRHSCTQPWPSRSAPRRAPSSGRSGVIHRRLAGPGVHRRAAEQPIVACPAEPVIARGLQRLPLAAPHLVHGFTQMLGHISKVLENQIDIFLQMIAIILAPD